jgi:hypothetical protein
MDAGKAPITEAFPHVSDWKKGEMSDREVLRIMLEVSVPGLLGLWRWRDRYLQDTPLKVTFRDAHAFTPAMAEAFEVILLPWFNGTAELKHSAFAAFMQGRD